MTLAERILALDDLEKVPVEVPEWAAALDGTQLYVRELTGAERGEFEAEWGSADDKKGGDLKTLRMKLVARTLVNGDGQRVFADKEIAALGKKSGAVIARLSDAAMELAGFSADAVDVALGN